MKAPRTRQEIAALWDLKSKTDATVWNYFEALHDEGLIRIVDYRQTNGLGAPAAVYAMQSAPFALPDIIRPLSREQERRERAERRAARNGGTISAET
jgi:hypothetical protein